MGEIVNESPSSSVPSLTHETLLSARTIAYVLQSSAVPDLTVRSDPDPRSYREALSSASASDWTSAIAEEYNSLQENDTWVLVPRPKNRRIVKCKWVFRRKYDAHGNLDRFKARLCAKGFRV